MKDGTSRTVRIFFMAGALYLSSSMAAFAGDWIADAKTGCKVWNPHPAPGETVSWEGPCQNGFAAGQGRLQWIKGGAPYERDEGVWRGGRQSGEGSQTWPGGRYEGQLADGMPHGRGVLNFGDARYEGTFLNGKPSGSGLLKNAFGVFDGQWRDGCFNDGKRRASIGVPVTACP